MIRINLLPVREAEKKKSGKQILVLGLVLVLALVAVLFFIQSEADNDLAAARQRNADIKKDIEKLKKKTSAVADLQRQQAELEQQKAVLDGLIEGQTGPVKMLDELSRMVTPIEDPKLKLEVQQRGWNPDWDPRRLWIDGFVEGERAVKVQGHARTNEDLAEFLTRLGSSRHFVEIKLNVSETVQMTNSDDSKMVKFDLNALVIYGPADVKRLAAGELGQGSGKKRRRRKKR